MTQTQAAAIWPVMKAFSEGKCVQAKHPIEKDQWDIQHYPTFDADWQWRIKPELFEGKFVIYSDGHVYQASSTTHLEMEGARIVILREVEDK